MMFLTLAAPGALAASFLQRAEVLVGPDGAKANPWQAILRAALVYGFAVLLVRLGHKRFLGRNSGIDVLLSIILGSVLSWGVNGSAPLGASLAASAALVGMHWVFAALSFRSKKFGKLVKGEAGVLIENGEMQQKAMRGSHVSEENLRESLRIQGRLEDVGKVKKACLERNGEISVIEKEPLEALKVPDIRVEGGVQTVRVKLV